MKTFPKPLSAKEERAYLALYQQGDQAAKDTLIERNMRLVAHIAKKYHSAERDFDDLLSTGMVGLIKAVNTFNTDKGSRLATYAAKCIDNEILMMLRSERKHSKDISLYEPLGFDAEGKEISFFDVMEADEKEIPDRIVLIQDIARLDEAFQYLKPKEQTVIKMRYGILGSGEFTQREIANQLSMSRSYVSRIEKAALEKLRLAMKD
ncbi:RNA polymerase sigma factor [Clostridia bacterium]|nr:RNA polymerase sigma factor [Clostridia bacterium]